MSGATNNNDAVEVTVIMTRALDPEVMDVLWETIEPLGGAWG